jgi:polygalacturonase
MAFSFLAFATPSHAKGQVSETETGVYNVKAFGAKGDGMALDSGPINAAIDAAWGRGGGTVFLPAGVYRSVSIRLRSNISLFLDQGATLLAADRGPGVAYDAAEENPNNKYQDYGHTHFHNSLIWGEKVENVSILGQGQIFGKGLVRDFTRNDRDGNKSISLRECSHVTIRDVTIRHGGWFCILATGVDHMTIDNLLIDTNRDGMDIDCCRDVHVSNCTVNSPRDDGICLKSSFPLGEARATENVTITNCHVSGFEEGTLLDHTYVRIGRTTGRIKFGTESNGGFKNIAISNCTFDHCGGFALETVDGGILEDVTISNITMRDISNSPIFLRLGRRMRGPVGTPIGTLHRVNFSNIRVIDAYEASIVAGIPGHPIEDVSFSNIRIVSKGGAKPEQATVVPPEQETGYPEPGSLGRMPAHGFYVRHAANVEFQDIEVSTSAADGRPPFAFDDVDGVDLTMVKGRHEKASATLQLKSVKNLQVRMVDGLRDARRAKIDGKM